MSSSFSPEQVILFYLRYKNGYDLFIDPDYVSWLLEPILRMFLLTLQLELVILFNHLMTKLL